MPAPKPANFVASWSDISSAYLQLAVNEGKLINGKATNHEYVGSVPLDKLQGLSQADQRLLLIAAVKAERDRLLALASPLQQIDLGITGTVTI